MLSQEKKGRNWLKIEPNTSLLMVRQTYFDRETEIPVELDIRMVDGGSAPQNLTATRVAEGLKTAGLFVGGATMTSLCQNCVKMRKSWELKALICSVRTNGMRRSMPD